MKNIYFETIQKVSEGARFTVDFENRTLKVNGRKIIDNGKYSGELGVEYTEEPLEEIQTLYVRYMHSIPSERSNSKRRLYFTPLDEDELDDMDMLYGERREVAQVELELYVLCLILNGSLVWDNFAKGQWFWQSKTLPELVLLKKWIA